MASVANEQRHSEFQNEQICLDRRTFADNQANFRLWNFQLNLAKDADKNNQHHTLWSRQSFS